MSSVCVRRRAAAAAAVAALVTPLPARALFGRTNPVPPPPQPTETGIVEMLDEDGIMWDDEDMDVTVEVDEEVVLPEGAQGGALSQSRRSVPGVGQSQTSALQRAQAKKQAIASGGVVIAGAGVLIVGNMRRGRRPPPRKAPAPKSKSYTPPPPPKEFSFDLLDDIAEDSASARQRATQEKAPAAVAARFHAEVEAAGTDEAEKQLLEEMSAAEVVPPAPQQAAVSAPPSAMEAQAAPEPPKKKLGLGLGGLFKKGAASNRPTTIGDAISAQEGGGLEGFSQALAGYLSHFAPPGSFAPDPTFLRDGELDRAGAEGTLLELVSSSGATSLQVADAIADVVNAMVVGLTDAAVAAIKDEDRCRQALSDLLLYMDNAGGTFAAVCPGVALDPPLRYNGAAKKRQLEELYENFTRAMVTDQSADMSARQERLRDMLNIKESKARSLEQKVLMEVVQKMMKEGGDGADLAALMGGMGGMGEGGGMPEGPEVAAQLEAFKAMVKDGNVSRDEVTELRKMYKDMGMDIDQMVAESAAAESTMDREAKELYSLLRQMLEQHPLAELLHQHEAGHVEQQRQQQQQQQQLQHHLSTNALLASPKAAVAAIAGGGVAAANISVSGSLLFWAHALPAFLALCAGLLANGGNKYVRLKVAGECGSRWADVYDGPDGAVCCGGIDTLLVMPVGLCRAVSLNWTTALMSQLWAALLVPVIGFVVNTGSQTPARVFCPREDVTTRHLRRFLLYAVLALWRTRVLYKGLKWLQRSALGDAHGADDCWYAQHTWRGVCRNGFDFSDHVVLFMAQYLAIQMFETFATLHENRKRFARVASAAVGALVSFVALGGMFDTVAFFHTRTESIVGFVVAAVGTFLPLWVLMTGRGASVTRWLDPSYYINIAENCCSPELAMPKAISCGDLNHRHNCHQS
ncbi:hypothetical protein JKP88DRAFT_354184 [Tribonema minus]|uniref:Uncharacterized protein n=1 Tax=Tribonema minus TaxID=303371 RepID=A0A835Z1E0_9STRA|nr:hypothetical protein JKP88DRAFT_354184 [Tribonema minus]